MCAVDLKSTCRTRVPTGPWLGSFCTGYSWASLPSAPSLLGGHSWTHTPWAPQPRAWRANAGRASGRKQSFHKPPKLSPSQALLQSACICSPDSEDRPAGNRGRESHIDGVLWNFHETTFCPVLSKWLVSRCYHPSPYKQAERLKLREAK